MLPGPLSMSPLCCPVPAHGRIGFSAPLAIVPRAAVWVHCSRVLIHETRLSTQGHCNGREAVASISAAFPLLFGMGTGR